MRRFIRAHLCHLWMFVCAALLAPALTRGQSYPGHRLSIGQGTLLLIPDNRTGLTIWARRDTRPGRRPSPDFVGWFHPDSIPRWIDRTRPLLSHAAPSGDEGLEGPSLTAVDLGWVSLVLTSDRGERPFLLTFGHPSERQRWVIEASSGEISRLLETLAVWAGRSRLAPPEGTGYANPTHRAATPDRERGALPAIGTGGEGEVWAMAELDVAGAVIGGTSRVLWASRPGLVAPVLEVLPGYRYRRRDGGRPARLAVYQRFRVRGEQ